MPQELRLVKGTNIHMNISNSRDTLGSTKIEATAKCDRNSKTLEDKRRMCQRERSVWERRKEASKGTETEMLGAERDVSMREGHGGEH